MSVELQHVITHGAVWFASLVTANLLLQLYVKRNPGCWLSQTVKGGMFNQAIHQYIVTIIGQGTVLPALFILSWLGQNTETSWWFASQKNYVSLEFFAYFSGYFMQDAIMHFKDNSSLVLLHHVSATVGSLFACSSECWLGLNMAVAMTFEVGSFAVELSDLDFGARIPSYYIFLVTNVLALLFIFHGLLVSPPSDPVALYCVAGGLIGGTVRTKECLECLQRVSKASVQVHKTN